MLPEILDEEDENNIYSYNPRMRFLEKIIIGGNILMILYQLIKYILRPSGADEVFFLIIISLFPGFYIFWWYRSSKLNKQGMDINLNGCVFTMQRIVILVMGVSMTFFGTVGICSILNPEPKILELEINESFQTPVMELLIAVYILIMGIAYIYYDMLVQQTMSKLTGEKKQI